MQANVNHSARRRLIGCARCGDVTGLLAPGLLLLNLAGDVIARGCGPVVAVSKQLWLPPPL